MCAILSLSAVAFLSLQLSLGQRESSQASSEPKDPTSGREVLCDLPKDQHLKNLPNGGGCCVWASNDHMARWHNFKPMIGVLQDRLGGANPKDVDKCFARRAPGFNEYVQATGTETEAMIDWCFRTGRLPCVTYGYGEGYAGSISHMVNLLHLDPKTVQQPRACVLDNNAPGVYRWMPRDEFFRRHRAGFGPWAVAYLLPPPPPVPSN